MSPVYKLGVWLLRAGTALASPFNAKAKARSSGAKRALQTLMATPVNQTCYWMHCASVGEYEQGRPLWEAIYNLHPEDRFVLSFFSPSGAQHIGPRQAFGEVIYLPWDTGDSSLKFVNRLSPKLAIFVKYEWWLGYHDALHNKQVPIILLSAAFRQNQAFFNSRSPLYRDYRGALTKIFHAFLQNSDSQELLNKHHYEINSTVVGDTRMDRTLTIRQAAFSDPKLDAWSEEKSLVLVAGSTWPTDERILIKVLESVAHLSLICAPHEISSANIDRLSRQAAVYGVISYSEYSTQRAISTRVLILDTLGMLSKVYRYGHIAYIGGGFGAGIHNTLEAAVYGLPIAFGPKYHRFDEALAFVEIGIASVVTDETELAAFVRNYSDPSHREQVLAKAENYIELHQGATQRVLQFLLAQQLV